MVMKRTMVLILLSAHLCTSGMAQLQPSVSDFLVGLRREPDSMPEFNDAIKIVDQIKPMSRSEVQALLPLIFDGLGYEQDAVKLYSALALFAVSLRPDCYVLLEPKLKEILSLLERSDNRLIMSVPMVVERMNIPRERVLPAYRDFVSDENKPAKAKAPMVCMLTKMDPHSEETLRAITGFVNQSMGTQERIDALNAIGCQPTDDEKLMNLVINSLNDTDSHVRGAAIAVIGRFGKKGADLAADQLAKIAGDADEQPEVRDMADRLLRKY